MEVLILKNKFRIELQHEINREIGRMCKYVEGEPCYKLIDIKFCSITEEYSAMLIFEEINIRGDHE